MYIKKSYECFVVVETVIEFEDFSLVLDTIIK